MRKIILQAILLVTILNFYSCNYLDVEKMFDDTMKYDSIFSRKEYLLRYMWNVASEFPNEAQIMDVPYTPGPLATDEAFAPFNVSVAGYAGMALVAGEIDEENITDSPIYQWNRMYKIIRKTNIILGRMNEVYDLTNLDKPDIWAYTYFMRAYAYYHLIMDFGPVILVGENVYPSNEQSQAYANVRSTYDECVDYACEQFEKAASYLPENQPIGFFGRPTKGAAYGLIARLRLQQASPAFNGRGQVYFGQWKRTEDGANYISMQYDDRKWAVAAAACERIMNMGYELHTVPADKDSFVPPTSETASFPNGVGDIDPLKSYSYMFNGETDGRKNKEYIWGKKVSHNDLKIKQCFPQSMDGYNGLCVSQKIVNMYYMNDGTDNWPEDAMPYNVDGRYDNTNFSISDETFSEYTLKSGTFNMYRNREMRFYASIGFSGRFWRAKSYSGTEDKKNKVIKYDSSSVTDGKHSSGGNKNDYPATGYVLTKNVHDDDSFSSGGIISEKYFGIIRYAEILLSYSEALNNLKGSHSVDLVGPDGETKTYVESYNREKIKEAFNPIRYRVGLPGVKESDLDDVGNFNKILQRERAIEFLCENRRYYDVRRWGIYEESERETMQGMDLNRSEMNGYFYSVVVDHPWIRNRVVDRKMMFLPISKYEVRKVIGMDQNPGWGD